MIRKDYGLFYIQETLQRTEGFVTQIYGSSTRQENVAIRCRIYSHSIIYGYHNQLSDNIFPKMNFSHTVLYTVTGNQYPVSMRKSHQRIYPVPLPKPKQLTQSLSSTQDF